MLCFDPTERVTVPTALEHPWLSAYHDVEDEPDCPTVFEKWREIEKLETMEEFRQALWDEIEDYRREVRGLQLELTALPPLPSSPKAAMQATGVEQPIRSPANFNENIFGLPSSEDNLVKSPIGEDEAQEETTEKTQEAEDTLPDNLPSISPETHRRSITTPTDPVVTYARRSSIMQPSRQGSTYNSPITSSHVPTFIEGSHATDKGGQSSTIAFPTQGYVVPARSRTGSTVGGEVTRKLLRTLSTVSIHESVEGLAGGLAGIAHIGKFITEVNTDADAPPSEVPKDFGIESETEEDEEEGSKKTRKFVV